MMMRGGSSFTQGLLLGQKAWNDADSARRQDELDAERKWRFGQEQDAAARATQNRADLSYIAQDGLTGITPNMTQPGPGGMGPVADPRDIDIRATRGLALNPTSMAPASTPVTLDDGVGGVYSAPAPPTARMSGLAADPAVAPVGLPGSGAVAGVPATPAAAGMTDAEKESRIGGIALRSGDVKGYREARESAREVKKRQAYDDFGKKLTSMTNDELAVEAKKWVTDNPDAAGTLGYDPKTRMFTIIHDTGAAQTIDPVQARAYALAAFQMGNGDVEKGMAAMLNADTVRKAQERQTRGDKNVLTEAVGKQGEAVFKDDELARFHKDEMAVKREQLGIQRAHLGMEKDKLAKGTLTTMVDAKTNEPVMGFAGIDPKTGAATFKKLDLPEGVRLPKDMTGQINRKDALAIAKDLVKDGVIDPTTKDKDGKNGKPYTLETATDAVMSAGSFGQEKKPSGVAVDMEKLKASLAGAPGNTPSSGVPTGGLQIVAPPAPPPVNPTVRVQQIKEALAKDDAIKGGGLSGMGGRMLQGGFLGMGERRALEDELRKLGG